MGDVGSHELLEIGEGIEGVSVERAVERRDLEDVRRVDGVTNRDVEAIASPVLLMEDGGE